MIPKPRPPKTAASQGLTRSVGVAAFARSPHAIGPIVVFALVYLAAFAIIFAPEGSLSSRAPTTSVASSR